MGLCNDFEKFRVQKLRSTNESKFERKAKSVPYSRLTQSSKNELTAFPFSDSVSRSSFSSSAPTYPIAMMKENVSSFSRFTFSLANGRSVSREKGH